MPEWYIMSRPFARRALGLLGALTTSVAACARSPRETPAPVPPSAAAASQPTSAQPTGGRPDSSTTASAALTSANAAGALAPRAAPGDPTAESHVLRVCADPDNLPFSNERQEGFENRIAALLAREMGDSLAYTWWPHRRGFIRNTLRAKDCDLIIGVPQGYDPVLPTKPYYRSAYFFASRADRNIRVTSLDDPALRQLKVGVNLIGDDYQHTPPAMALAQRGIVSNVRGYMTYYDPDFRPEDIIKGLANGDIDVAVVWGPLAGYFGKRLGVPLAMTQLPDSDATTGQPFVFDISMGVRRSDKAFRTRLDQVLERSAPAIRQILRDYDVPTVAAPAAAATPASQGAKP
jgi:mxaJ protein